MAAQYPRTDPPRVRRPARGRRPEPEDTFLEPTEVALGRDLRVTRRCAVEDLNAGPDATVLELGQKHALVAKFRKMRSQHPLGVEKLRDVPSRLNIYNLHAGRQRGVTWYDEEYDVVWLLAAGFHASGASDDAYVHFVDLARAERLLPTVEDYEVVIRDHDARNVPLVLAQLSSLSRLAMSHPYAAHSLMLANDVRVTLRAEVVRDRGKVVAAELFLAIAVTNLQPGWLALIRRGVLPIRESEIWEYASDFPDRNYDPTELRFSCVYEVPSAR